MKYGSKDYKKYVTFGFFCCNYLIDNLKSWPRFSFMNSNHSSLSRRYGQNVIYSTNRFNKNVLSSDVVLVRLLYIIFFGIGGMYNPKNFSTSASLNFKKWLNLLYT
jgi:hypothetical protein